MFLNGFMSQSRWLASGIDAINGNVDGGLGASASPQRLASPSLRKPSLRRSLRTRHHAPPEALGAGAHVSTPLLPLPRHLPLYPSPPE